MCSKVVGGGDSGEGINLMGNIMLQWVELGNFREARIFAGFFLFVELNENKFKPRDDVITR